MSAALLWTLSNLKPANRMEFLLDHNFVANHPKAIALVLKDTPGLDQVCPWQLCWLIVCTVAWWKLLYCLWKALRCCIDCFFSAQNGR